MVTPKREWHVERVNFSELSQHLNNLERQGHTIVQIVHYPQPRSPLAALIVSYYTYPEK